MGVWDILAGAGSGVGSRAGFLLLVLVGYLVAGGFLFQFLEWDAREAALLEATEEMEEDRSELLKSLWAETLSNSEEDWIQIANERMDIYDHDVQEFLASGMDLDDEDDDNPWTILGSIFYCFTVVTTIGYGNIYPTTVLGRLGTIIYGLIGIPLTLIYLAEVGSWVTRRLKKMLAKRWPDMDNDSGDFDFSLGLGLLVTLVYLLAGALVFDLLEDDWGFLDAAYFSFISFSTIGFGDILLDDEWWMLVMMLYSLSALSLCASCLGLIQNSLEAQLSQQQTRFQSWMSNRWNWAAVGAKKKAEEEEEEDDDPNTASYTWGQ